MKVDIVERVVEFYLNSGDFNGMPINKLLDELKVDAASLKEPLVALIREGTISVNFGDNHPNAHIKAFPPESAENQIAKLLEGLTAESEDEDTEEPEQTYEFTDEEGVNNLIYIYFIQIHDYIMLASIRKHRRCWIGLTGQNMRESRLRSGWRSESRSFHSRNLT